MASIQKRGSKWRALVRRNGRSFSGTFNSKASAAAWAKRVEDELAAGKLFVANESTELTLREAAERRIDRAAPSATTEARIRWWVALLGDKKLHEISKHDIEKGVNSLRFTPKLRPRAYGSPEVTTEPRSPATINRYIRAISATLEDYVDPVDGLPFNPAKRIRRFAEPLSSSRAFSQDEIQKLLEACQRSTYERLYFLAVSALVTGARRGELLGLTWDRIDVERGEGYLRPQDTKTRQARTLVWVGPAFEELKRWSTIDRERPSGPLFPSPLNPSRALVGLQKYWDKARAEAGVRMRWHDWRHQCGTYLAMEGANAFLIADVLGHANVKTTRRYTHLTTASKRQALEAVFNK